MIANLPLLSSRHGRRLLLSSRSRSRRHPSLPPTRSPAAPLLIAGGVRGYRAGALFPGQGDQYAGMADGAAGCPRRSELYARARGVLGYDLAAACRSEDSVHHTAVSQPAMYVAGLAAAYGEVRGAEIHERDAGDERIDGASEHRSGTGEPGEPGGILSSPGSAGRSETSGVAGDLAASAFAVAAAQVDVACGLSLGEYTALAFAGSVSFEAGLRLVRARGEAMQAASELEPSGMVSVTGLGRGECEALCARIGVMVEGAEKELHSADDLLSRKAKLEKSTRRQSIAVAAMSGGPGATIAIPKAPLPQRARLPDRSRLLYAKLRRRFMESPFSDTTDEVTAQTLESRMAGYKFGEAAFSKLCWDYRIE